MPLGAYSVFPHGERSLLAPSSPDRKSTPQSLIQTLAHAEMVAAGGISVAGEQDGG